jgi:hypothetical protein
VACADRGHGCAGHGWDFQGGTVAYSAPELLRSARSKQGTAVAASVAECGPAVDCWSYGVTALQLLTGFCLFQLADIAKPADILPQSDQWRAWCMRETADLHAEWVRDFPALLAVLRTIGIARQIEACACCTIWGSCTHTVTHYYVLWWVIAVDLWALRGDFCRDASVRSCPVLFTRYIFELRKGSEGCLVCSCLYSCALCGWPYVLSSD